MFIERGDADISRVFRRREKRDERHMLAERDLMPVATVATLSGKRGELVQGCTSGGIDFLCAMPFPLPATVRLRLVAGRDVITEPLDFPKTQRLVRRLLDDTGLFDTGALLRFRLSEKIGVGCGTSSQTMQLAATALAGAGFLSITPALLGPKLAAVEPCDIFPANGALLLWNFKTGTPLSEPAHLPPGAYVAGYPIDRCLITDEVDKSRPVYSAEQLRIYDAIHEHFPALLRAGELSRVGEMTATSADINQQWFPRGEVAGLRRLRARGDIDGYFVGHSGTVVGAFSSDPDRQRWLVREFSRVVGPRYDIAAFVQDADSRGVPFLNAAGRSLIRFVS